MMASYLDLIALARRHSGLTYPPGLVYRCHSAPLELGNPSSLGSRLPIAPIFKLLLDRNDLIPFS